MHYLPLSSLPGRLAFGPRPRSASELDEFQLVICLLTDDEIAELGLDWLQALRVPIPDRHCPPDTQQLAVVLDQAADALNRGDNVYIHCRAGIGRAGLVTACLLSKLGYTRGIWEMLANARGVAVPDTDEQREWVETYRLGAKGASTLDEALERLLGG